jgi:transposase
MVFNYVKADRRQLFLLPVDMRDWLPEGHLALFLLDVLADVDTSALHAGAGEGGPGRPAYDPDVLLAVLFYAYCTGERSSRKIERLCRTDIAYRVLAANTCPDHCTIARFRQAYDAVAMAIFVQALALCAGAGLTKVGLVAIDGTKVEADASMGANVDLAKLGRLVEAMFGEAGAADEKEDGLFGDANGDELPAELTDRTSRAARLAEAGRRLRAAKGAQAEKAAEAEERRGRAEQAAAATGRAPMGRPPTGREVARAEKALAEAEARAAQSGARLGPRGLRYLRQAQERLAKAKAKTAQQGQPAYKLQPAHGGEPRANTTDPDSAIMKTRSGYLQGYNAQVAVDESGVVLAALVSADAGDVGQLVPMLRELTANLATAGAGAEVGTALFDAGYWSEQNATAPGPDRLIATTKSWKLRQKAKQDGHRAGPPPKGASAAEAMEHRLCTKEGSATYARRSVMVEPVFGQHKHLRGFRRFARRGLTAVQAEWQLMNTVHNLLKLYHHSYRPALTG